MPTNRFQESLYITEDIINEYHKRRNGNLSKAEIRDLLKCLTDFIRYDYNNYAYEMPHVGTFFEPFSDVDYRRDKDSRRKMAEYYYGNYYFKGRHLHTEPEKLEKIQNEYYNNLEEPS